MGVRSPSEPEVTLSRPGNPSEGVARCASSAWGGQLAPLSIEDAAVVVWPRIVVEGAGPPSRGKLVGATTDDRSRWLPVSGPSDPGTPAQVIDGARR